ncbi:MAG: MBL fold metallo-hydrolase [Candidatus Methanomethylophilaceae archaeon]|nr:MBL fold metallo-hydrolase [Candidatus Methanomethylophilaceae archaeon]
MRIRWHGHSCFEFEDGNLRLVIDPHDGRSIGIKPPSASANLVLMTHNHYDHNAARMISGTHSDLLLNNGPFKFNGIDFKGYPTFHDQAGGSQRGPNTMYRFEMEGISVLHCGDLGCIPDEQTLAEIRGVDMMFVPTGEVFTLPLEQVRRLIELVNPNIVVPMHYRFGGLTLPITGVDEFLKMIPSDSICYVGNEIEISREDIDMKECWVFDRRGQ